MNYEIDGINLCLCMCVLCVFDFSVLKVKNTGQCGNPVGPVTIERWPWYSGCTLCKCVEIDSFLFK